jgi:tetratricopeptide (TPR) repeat protein
VLWASAEHDLHRAVESYEAILQRLPRNRIALRQLEVLSARLEQWPALTAAIALGSEPCEDADYRSACALTIAALHEQRLGDLPAAAQAAVEVLERAPTNPEALATLERQARQTRNGERLLQVLSRQLRGSQTVAEQAAVLCGMAAVHANAGEMGRAVEFYRMATEQREHAARHDEADDRRSANAFIPAPRGWLRAAREVEAIDQAALALEAEALCSVDLGWRAQCDYAAARGWRKLGLEREARAALTRVLELEPNRPEAIKDLTTLYKESEDYRALAELYDHQIAHADEPRRCRDLLARKADLQRRRLQDVLGARHSINRALELDPDDVQLLSTLAELCRASSDWEALARVNQRLTRLVDDHVLLKALHFEQGKLWEERLGQPRQAIAEYRRVLELDDSDLGALTRLGELLFVGREWEAAAKVTSRLAQRDEDRGRVKGYHLRLAEIYADGLLDVPVAMQCCRRALAMDPGDLEATDRLAELLHRQGDARGLNAHIQSCLTVHRSRLDREPFMINSYRALESIFARQGQRDHVHVVRSLLCAIGAATRDRFETVRDEREDAPLGPRRPVTDDELLRLLLHPMERGPLRALLDGAAPLLRKVHGRADRSESKARKITARSRPELAGLIKQLARDLGCGKVEAYLVPGGLEQLRVEDTSPPALYLGEELDDLSPAELRFRVARLLAAVRLGHTLPYRLGAEALGRDVAALLSVLCTTFAPPVDAELLDERRQRLDKAMGRRLRAKLETAALELIDRPFLPNRWLEWMQQSEDRIALTITGDVVAALEVLKHEEYHLGPRDDDLEALARSAGPRLREFLVFVVSDELLTLRERLGLALE